MKNFEYMILRYLPDRVSGEFVNIGVIMFDINEKKLFGKVIDRVGRISAMFPNINTRTLSKTLKFLQTQLCIYINRTQSELNFEKFSDINQLATAIIPKDNSSIFFTEVNRGMDIDIKAAFDELFDRVISKNYDKENLDKLQDKEVWSKMYKKYFAKQDILKYLTQHTVKTTNDELVFERAGKNGIWHCYEPVTFNLSRPDAVKNKVYKWSGKIEELQSSVEPVNLYLLAKMTDNNFELNNFIKAKLDNKTFGHSNVKIISEDIAEEFVQKEKELFENHV